MTMEVCKVCDVGHQINNSGLLWQVVLQIVGCLIWVGRDVAEDESKREVGGFLLLSVLPSKGGRIAEQSAGAEEEVCVQVCVWGGGSGTTDSALIAGKLSHSVILPPFYNQNSHTTQPPPNSTLNPYSSNPPGHRRFYVASLCNYS